VQEACVTEQNPAGHGSDDEFEPITAYAGQADDQGDEGTSVYGDFATRASEAAEAAKGGDGDRVNLAVTELLATVAERTNELQRAQAEIGQLQAEVDDLKARLTELLSETPAVPADTPATGTTGDAESGLSELMERTADLQRLQAEFANYRKRVDRDRVAVREIALQNVLTELLPVLDDIGRARDHDELHGGFRRVAESLETTVTKLGLEQFGTEGDAFDPTIHEALMHSVSADVSEDTCVKILQPGYRLGDRIVRPARVAVAQPEQGGYVESASGE
jgi:molecular chaperone GrpE